MTSLTQRRRSGSHGRISLYAHAETRESRRDRDGLLNPDRRVLARSNVVYRLGADPVEPDAMPRLHARTAPEQNDSDDDSGKKDDPIYTARRTRSALELRQAAAMGPSMRFAAHLPRATGLSALLGEGLGWRKPKITQITTAPGQLGAGETETEADEPSNHLPTTRIIPVSDPLVPPSVVTVLLFESSRLLSVVPAAFGVLINAWCLCYPPGYSPAYGSPDHRYNTAERSERWGRTCPPDRGDYFVAVLWALLTAHQCLRLTTGLLHRWRAYYSPLSTLIRLLALQAICWPATHFTLNIVGSLGTNFSLSEHNLFLESALLRWTTARPDVCWAVIGTTTCISRSIQIWVTSNLLLSTSAGSRTHPSSATAERLRPRRTAVPEETRKLVGRKWNWAVVARVCIFPAGCLYFVMAWIAAWRREVGGC